MELAQVDSDVKLLIEKLEKFPEPVVEPALIAVSGLPGTGKSYFSRKLAERLPSLILESDALRKSLFSTPNYSTEESARLFKAIHRLIEELLKKGISLILDATNLSEIHREYLYNITDRLKAKLILVRVEAPPELVRERLETRVKSSPSESASDAGWAVYQKLKPTVQRIRRQHYAVDTSRDVNPVLDKIIKVVNR